MVVCSEGKRQRFLRGMVTHDLVRRGVDFDTAYATARAVRDRIGDRDEIAAAEIEDLVSEHLEGVLGHDPTGPRPTSEVSPDLKVIYDGVEQPFSRGLLARSVYAAGPDLDRAYRLVSELEASLVEEKVTEVTNGELARRMGDLIEALEGPEAGRHYRVVRHLRRLPRPLVLYVGGASGTGKSTLSLELAPLLRVYRIISTDTIRQVMRMVFSPNILPAIHGSSFEVGASYEQWAHEPAPESDGHAPESHLTSYFEEQVTRVLVGVRAVVERAIKENMSVIVEGVHLLPPFIPFADLDGAAYQVPLVLATLDTETHRTRFLSRARHGGRRAERYVENFESIRIIHDHVLQRCEQHDVPLLDTSSGHPPIAQTLGLVAGVLQHRMPGLDLLFTGTTVPVPSLLIIIDGLADRPVRALGGRTPLQAANLPTLDRLATEGRCGLADPVAPGVVPDTAAGTLALFGQSPSGMKRGPLEALGAGFELSAGDIAMRGNLATLDDEGRVVDRRAGRIREDTAELAAALDRLPLPGEIAGDVEVRVRPATEHRLAIVLRGDGLSPRIQGSDPGEGASPGPPLTPEPLDPTDERAVDTARILALFHQEARKVLDRHPINKKRQRRGLPVANAVLTRGAGRLHRLVPLEEAGLPLRISCIGGDRTILGLARWLGARTVNKPGMTANLDTDLGLKFDCALRALDANDLVILHLKGADIAAHDQRPDLKVSFLEAVDAQLARLLDEIPSDVRVAVSGDHATLSESGQHGADPLPVVVWGAGLSGDDVTTFDELAAAGGSLRRFPLQLLLTRLFDHGLGREKEEE